MSMITNAIRRNDFQRQIVDWTYRSPRPINGIRLGFLLSLAVWSGIAFAVLT